MRFLVALALLTVVPIAGICGHRVQQKSNPSDTSKESQIRDEITQKEQLWISAINSSSSKTAALLLDDSFEYSSSAQSDFDAMVIGGGEDLPRSEYLNHITDADVFVKIVSRQIKVSIKGQDRAMAHFKIEVRAGVSARYGTVPKIMPGIYEITDEWVNKEGWKAVSRDARKLVTGRIIPAQ